MPCVYNAAGHTAHFITAEDVIVAKLIAHRQTGSDKHLRDVRGVLVTQWGELDLEAIRQEAQTNGTLGQFESLLEAARQEMEQE